MMTTNVEARVLTDDVGEPILQKIDKALCELSNAREDVETGKHQSAILSFLRMAKEYIESVRDDIEVVTSAYFDNLSQPQPVAQGEAAAVVLLSITSGEPVMQVMEGWDRLPEGNYLLHVQPTLPPGFRARLMGLIAEAWVHGKDEAQLGSMADELIANLYATPTITTGYRVVPVEPTEEMRIAGGAYDAGDSYYVVNEIGEDAASVVWKAMIAASPSTGGV